MRTVVRASASPGGVVEFLRTYFETDIGDVLPLIHVPTLVLYRPETPPRNEPAGTPTVETDARRLADAIPDGRAVSVPGPDASPFVGAALTTEIERFLASPHETVVPPRASARSERRSPGSRWRPGRESPRWARPGEVLVSRTVRDLVSGSGIEFHDRGEHELKGVLERGSSSRSAGSAR